MSKKADSLQTVPVSLTGELPNFHIGVEDLLHGMVSLTGELVS